MILDKNNLPANMMIGKICRKCGSDIRYTSKDKRCVLCKCEANHKRYLK